MIQKTVLITGATSGIGKATAVKFAENRYNIIITGRRRERLEKLKEDIKEKYPVNILLLNFDVRDKQQVQQSLSGLQGTWRRIDVLVNNAGLAAGLDTIQDGSLDDWEQMMATNVMGLLYVSRIIMPKMVEQGFGHVINIGSIAGKQVYPKGNVYCASKHAVDALTQAMRIDLLPHGVRVTQIAPGVVETEFSEVRLKGDKETAAHVYKGFEPLKGGDIAEMIYFVSQLPPHVNINDMVVMPTAQANATTFNKKS